MSDRSLFDADQYAPATCKHCGATREPGQEKAAACRTDREREEGIGWTSRPLSCLNQYRPEHARIPY
jgi:hypothetical protein